MASHSRPPNPIHFFKVILKSSLESLRIPNKFTGRYGGDLPNPVFLKPPDGKEWKVYWTKHDNGVWFQKGWKEFASFYSLDMGHLVLFKYGGTPQFDVHVFDQSAIEMDYPFHDTSGQKDNLKLSDENIIEILDDMPSNQKVRRKTSISSPRPYKKMGTATSEDVEKRSSNLQNLHVDVKTKGGQSPGTQFEKSTNAELKICKHELEEDIGERTFTKNKCLNSEHKRRMKLTAVEKVKALKRASTFRSENPFVMVVMQPSYVNNKFHLFLPMKFAKTYLHIKNNIGSVKLLVEDGVWSVGYVFRRSGKQHTVEFSCGWKQFCEENDLKVGDVCVFELTQRLKLALKVSIFRATTHPVHSDDSAPGNGENGVKLEGGKSTQRTSLLFRPRESRALEEAKRFISKNPFFTLYIRTCHLLNTKPHVPKGFYTRYVRKKKNVMIQMGKRSWPVKIMSYADLSKARFSAGWASFARESKLQVGDICIFELIQRGKDEVLRVHVSRSPS